jgi:hypothetical protein
LQALPVPVHSLAPLLSFTYWSINMKSETIRLRRTIDQTKLRSTLAGRLKSILSNAKRHSIPRGHGTVDLTFEFLLAMWKKQKGICAYTGWPMNTHTGSPMLVSLERIDNEIGYSANNCALVCWIANNAKGTYSMPDFVAMCNAVAQHNKGESPSLVVDADAEPTHSLAIQSVTRTLLATDSVNWQVYVSYQAEIDALIAELKA